MCDLEIASRCENQVRPTVTSNIVTSTNSCSTVNVYSSHGNKMKSSGSRNTNSSTYAIIDTSKQRVNSSQESLEVPNSCCKTKVRKTDSMKVVQSSGTNFPFPKRMKSNLSSVFNESKEKFFKESTHLKTLN